MSLYLGLTDMFWIEIQGYENNKQAKFVTSYLFPVSGNG
jgi:hypothetical protein